MRFLSEIMKKTVIDLDNNKIGKFKDFIVSSNMNYPIVEAISIRTSDKTDMNIPWEYIESINKYINSMKNSKNNRVQT
jgi:sporulation protein YlmC with PRC-barrel domain